MVLDGGEGGLFSATLGLLWPSYVELRSGSFFKETYNWGDLYLKRPGYGPLILPAFFLARGGFTQISHPFLVSLAYYL